MRMLFVDDEPRILTGIENALIFASDDWSADFAVSGDEAIELMKANSYDVLVTDMRMPGLTGADVLEYAKSADPKMVRIALSGEVDADLAERAMPLTHEFVSKPCDPDDLFAIIERIHDSAQSLEHETVRSVLGSLDRLPSQPAVLASMQQVIERGEGIDEIARVIEADLAVASSVLRTANSAFYGFRNPAETVRDAVARLGTQTVTGVVVNAEVAAWAPREMANLVARLNLHSARIAETVRRMIGAEIPQASLAGLLHDVGTLVLITQFPDEFRLLQEIVEGGGEANEEAERSIFGASHAEIGAYMLQMWKIDPVVVAATRHHHDRRGAEGPARRVVDAITAAAMAESGVDEPPEGLDQDLVDLARILHNGDDR